MKNLKILTGLSLIFFSLFLITSCKQQNMNKEKEETSSEELQELKKELKDVGLAIDNLAAKEGDDFKSGAQNILYDFNQKIDAFESDLKQRNEKIDSKTQAAIDNLKDEGNKLQVKLDKFSDTNQENWEEFKAEVKHDFSEFGKSVKDFFKDNVKKEN